MTYIEQGPKEGDAEHMLKNAAGLGLTPTEKGRLREAFRLAAGSKGEKRRGAELVADVRRRVLESAAQAQAAEHRHEAALGALLLGEPGALDGDGQAGSPISQFNDAGAARLASRDGLAHLCELGHITRHELEVGLLYRAVYELLDCDLRSQLNDSGGGGGTNIDRFVVARLHRARKSAIRQDIERAVVAASRGPTAPPHGNGLNEIKVLRAVAGEGRSLRSLCSGGAMQATYRAALHRALAAAWPVILAEFVY